MILIIWLSLCMGFMIYVGFKDGKTIVSKLSLAFLLGPIATVIVGGFLYAFVISTIYMISSDTLEYSHSYKIVAADDQHTLVVSRYNADSELKNYYIAEFSNGDFKQKQAPAKYSTIREKNISQEQAKVDIYFKKTSKDRLIRKEVELVNQKLNLKLGRYTGDTRWKFIVPKGSVKRSISFDVQ